MFWCNRLYQMLNDNTTEGRVKCERKIALLLRKIRARHFDPLVSRHGAKRSAIFRGTKGRSPAPPFHGDLSRSEAFCHGILRKEKR